MYKQLETVQNYETI